MQAQTTMRQYFVSGLDVCPTPMQKMPDREEESYEDDMSAVAVANDQAIGFYNMHGYRSGRDVLWKSCKVWTDQGHFDWFETVTANWRRISDRLRLIFGQPHRQ